ncbi:spore germination protein [Paenibacillus sp. ACRRX]|uniref:GerAB/ArcD/ProY family transporter n=1 Tax=unclassified Paenibacillus TaxID=185978 RepID=UPI001EF6E1A0|nr:MULTISPECIES: endospore germination permease [unclassified Paenibacillus]MCG7406864.1 spore germination protein [Paenibacillus sp. ACRRX]MDK8179797.1 endospore germination permease [Paenibacillus sp. UMB4589-SE434]
MKKSEITLRQFILLIHGTQVGTGVLSLPRMLAETAGTDGWISIIFGWIINLVLGIVIVWVMAQYPHVTFPQLLTRLFGKFIAALVIIALLCNFALSSWSIFADAMLYIKAWFLPMTQTPIIMCLFIVPALLTAKKSMLVVAQYNEFVFFFTLWMPLIMLFPLVEAQHIHLLPVLKEGWVPVLKGVDNTTVSFIGNEIIFLVYPFLKKKETAVYGVMIGNTLTMLLYLFVTLISFAYFSPDEVTQYSQPVLNLLKVVEFRFLERIDVIFLALYLFVVSTSWVPYVHSTGICAAQLVKSNNHSPFVLTFGVLIILLSAWIEPSWQQSTQWMNWCKYSGLIVAYLLPIILMLYIKAIQLMPGRSKRSEV